MLKKLNFFMLKKFKNLKKNENVKKYLLKNVKNIFFKC